MGRTFTSKSAGYLAAVLVTLTATATIQCFEINYIQMAKFRFLSPDPDKVLRTFQSLRVADELLDFSKILNNEHHENCLIHVVKYFSNLVDFTTIQVPMVLTSLANPPQLFYLNDTSLRYRPKLIHTWCHINIALTAGLEIIIKGMYDGAGSSRYTSENMLLAALTKDLILTRSPLWSRRGSFRHAFNIVVGKAVSQTLGYHHFLKVSTLGLSPTMVLVFPQRHGLANVGKGLEREREAEPVARDFKYWAGVCQVCVNENQVKFNYEPVIGVTAKQMVEISLSRSENGRKVCWGARFDSKIKSSVGRTDGAPTWDDFWTDSNSKESSPFNRFRSIKLLPATVHHLWGSLNYTLSELRLHGREYLGCPFLIQYKRDYQLETARTLFGTQVTNGDLLLDSAVQGKFKIITSDNVTRQEGKEGSLLLRPFQLETWVVFLVAFALTTAVGTAGLIRRSKSGLGYCQFVTSVFWFLGASLDQCDGILLTAPSSGTGSRISRSLSIFACILWLLAGIVVNNSYKGVAKSQYTVSYPYRTSWTHLLELRGFTTYTSVDDSLCKQYKGMELCPGCSKHLRCVNNEAMLNDPGCSLFYEAKNIITKLEDNVLPNCTELCPFMRKIYWETEAVCDHELPGLIHGNLSEPKSAFICTEDTFHYYWNIFQSVTKSSMGSKAGGRFHHNWNQPDSLFSRRGFFYFLPRQSLYYKNVLQKTLLDLENSGILGLWRKWEGIRFPAKNFRKHLMGDEHIVKIFQKLAFETSDVGAIFRTAFYGWATSLAVFVMEQMTRSNHGMKLMH